MSKKYGQTKKIEQLYQPSSPKQQSRTITPNNSPINIAFIVLEAFAEIDHILGHK